MRPDRIRQRPMKKKNDCGTDLLQSCSDSGQLRRDMIRRRKKIGDRKTREQAIKDRLAPFVKGKTVASYYAIRGEADIHQEDWYLPVTDPATHTMRFGKGVMRTGAYGIPEPDPALASFIDPGDIQVILVPMVAFDGVNRLGYGQGYYDRFLPGTQALRIGIAFEEQQAQFDCSPWDVPMDMVITPAGIVTPAYNETGCGLPADHMNSCTAISEETGNQSS